MTTTRHDPRRPRRDLGYSLVHALFLGYPLGVVGNIVVASIVLTIMAGPSAGLTLGAFGGLITGLFTGGPVFALVTVRRPTAHAWICIFGPCLLATFLGVAIHSAQSGNVGFFFLFPLVTLLVGSIVYVACTKHLAPVDPLKTSDPTKCVSCGYSLVGLGEGARCPECGTAPTGGTHSAETPEG